jgi:hypothetical protein
MSSWNGFEDDVNNEYSTPSSPFSTAFRTPRPPGIETGVREVPSNLSEHSKDLYDALEVEFNKVIINNLSRRNKTRLAFKDRGYMIRHLTITESTWQSLSIAENGNKERNRRQKALKYFAIKGTLFI